MNTILIKEAVVYKVQLFKPTFLEKSIEKFDYETYVHQQAELLLLDSLPKASSKEYTTEELNYIQADSEGLKYYFQQKRKNVNQLVTQMNQLEILLDLRYITFVLNESKGYIKISKEIKHMLQTIIYGSHHIVYGSIRHGHKISYTKGVQNRSYYEFLEQLNETFWLDAITTDLLNVNEFIHGIRAEMQQLKRCFDNRPLCRDVAISRNIGTEDSRSHVVNFSSIEDLIF